MDHLDDLSRRGVGDPDAVLEKATGAAGYRGARPHRHHLCFRRGPMGAGRRGLPSVQGHRLSRLARARLRRVLYHRTLYPPGHRRGLLVLAAFPRWSLPIRTASASNSAMRSTAPAASAFCETPTRTKTPPTCKPSFAALFKTANAARSFGSPIPTRPRSNPAALCSRWYRRSFTWAGEIHRGSTS